MKTTKVEPVRGLPEWVLDVASQLPPMCGVGELAKVLGLCPSTVRRLLDSGKLAGFRSGAERGAAWRIARSEVAAFLARGGAVDSPRTAS